MISSPQQNTFLGIVYMLLAIFIFSIVNLVVKKIAGTYSIWQLTFCRFFFALIPVFFLLSLKSLQTKRGPLLGTIGVLNALSAFLIFEALHIGRLADVTAIAYSSILFVTAFSVPLLKEKVGIYRWSAVVIGFVGVLVMANPGGTSNLFELGALLSILFAALDGFVMILLRLVTRTERVPTVVFYALLSASLVSLPFMLLSFKAPLSGVDAFYLIFIGVGGGLGQLFLTRAYHLASAVAVAPMIYTALIWGALFGIVLFAEPLTTHFLVGGSLVIVCSLYIIYRAYKENPKTQPLIHDNLID
jgi:drug/metabolite transporter (DMT)-like permease